MQRHLVPLVVAAALLCAGCSGGSGSGSGSAREAEKPGKASSSRSAEDHGAAVRAAVAATRKCSARIDERIEIGDGTTDYVISIKGDFDWAGARGRLVVALRNAAVPGKTSPRMDEIFDGDTVYMGGFAEMEGSWGSIRRDRAEAHYVLRAPMNDPEHVLRQVAQMRRISKVGEETVNGASTVHYRGVLPDETVTLRMAKDMRAKIDSAREQVGGLTVYADAWIDRNGRIARTRLDWPMGTAGARATMNLADHGKPVRAKAPDPGKVVPMPDLGGPLPG
ncbi:hypothetical protein PUR34_40135 [Streptomyces sp. JV185]|uniref:hypothetical protein n=1 Tax=Streptomyces sp. JV185 TaxID=858638 RepID=UPI002E77B9DF|nr:hypothetical protein [Streptomyces sp. JV185]MEE1774220.1 hypothetical protein [Streptomyces sp. JV185]